MRIVPHRRDGTGKSGRPPLEISPFSASSDAEGSTIHPKTSGIHHRTRDVGLPCMVCPVDAEGRATRMSETGRPSRSLPPSGAIRTPDTARNPLRPGTALHSKRRYGKLLPRTRTGCGPVARCPTQGSSSPCAGGCALRPLRAASIVRQRKTSGTAFPIRAGLPGEERSVPNPDPVHLAHG